MAVNFLLVLTMPLFILVYINTAFAASAVPLFVDQSFASGVASTSGTSGTAPYLGDYDGDGRVDIFFGYHSIHLLQQRADGTFMDTTTSSGMQAEGAAHHAAWGDCNNDGHLDLYQTMGGARGKGNVPKRFYVNQGNGHFSDLADTAGVNAVDDRARTVSWADVNNDGFLDMMIPIASKPGTQEHLYINDGTCNFTATYSSCGSLIGANKTQAGGSIWADYNRDGNVDSFLLSWHKKTRLNANKSNGVFKDRSNIGINHEANANACGMAWRDFISDGYADLYVTRGYNATVDCMKSIPNSIKDHFLV